MVNDNGTYALPQKYHFVPDIRADREKESEITEA